MKTKVLTFLKASALILVCISAGIVNAQTRVANLRPYDQTGINVYEAPKDTNVVFERLKVQFGAGFTQSFQGLKHENTSGGLYKMSPGFNTANANFCLLYTSPSPR